MESIVASAMKGYLRRMSEEEALKKVESIIEPKVIQLFVFFVKHFSLKKASEFPVLSKGFSLL